MSVTPQQPLPPFGWYPDPTGLHLLRWWTGTAWTDQLETPRPELQPAVGFPMQRSRHAAHGAH